MTADPTPHTLFFTSSISMSGGMVETQIVPYDEERHRDQMLILYRVYALKRLKN